jgi:DNA repair ATPase RecN
MTTDPTTEALGPEIEYALGYLSHHAAPVDKDAAIADLRKHVADRLREAEETLRDLLDERNALAADLDAARERLDDALPRLGRQEGTIKQLRGERDAAREEIERLQKANTRRWADAKVAAAAARTREKELREKFERATWIAVHLFAMVTPEQWRDTGGDDGQGHYEGDYRAEQMRDELNELLASATEEDAE